MLVLNSFQYRFSISFCPEGEILQQVQDDTVKNFQIFLARSIWPVNLLLNASFFSPNSDLEIVIAREPKQSRLWQWDCHAPFRCSQWQDGERVSFSTSEFDQGFCLTEWIPFANIPTVFKRFRSSIADVINNLAYTECHCERSEGRYDPRLLAMTTFFQCSL